MIVGLGGLGGHLADNLVRLGVSKLMLVDFDVFEVSNLNRQLYSTQHNIGDYKVHVLREQLQKINQDCLIEVSIEKIEDLLIENLRDALKSPIKKSARDSCKKGTLLGAAICTRLIHIS